MGKTYNSKQKTALYKSISHIADILQCIMNDVNTVTEVANYCHLSKSTVSRLLRTLKESKIVVQDPSSRRFYLGGLIAQCSRNPFTTHKYLVVSSHKPMLRLRDLFGETVFISILIGIQYMNLHQISAEYELNITPDGKIRGPLLAGATSKALFSQVSDEDLNLALKYFEISQQKNDPSFNKVTFTEKLSQVKQQGYIITCGETLPGVLGIAAPIRNYICPGALSVLGPESRLKPKMTALIRELKKSTDHISNTLAGIYRSKDDDISTDLLSADHI